MIDIHEMVVLIVEDSMSMCKSIHSMMKVIGYGRKFFFAHNGKEALDLLSREPVEMVMLDYNMPVMTGAQVLGHIRADRKLRDLPVIMITAEAYRDYVAEVGESEIDAYILKPVTIRLLEEKVKFVVKNVNNPPPMVEHLKRARQFEDQGDLDAAITEAELAVNANPKASRPIRELGYYYYQKGDLPQAEKWLLKAAKMNYLDVFAFHHLGEIYLEFNDIEKASHFYEKAMKISPRQLSRGVRFGKVLMQRKMVQKAIQVFEKIFTLPGSTPELREDIADFCMQKGEYAYAVKILESLENEIKHRWDLYFKLGIALDSIGERIKAVTFLTQGAEIDKTNKDIRIYLAKMYLALHKPILAERPLSEILRMDPNHEEAKKLLEGCY
jgi:DNA-binding response OmpR family regulator